MDPVGPERVPRLAGKLYYEVTRPGAAPRYNVELKSGVRWRRFRVAVLEMAKRPNHWRVWLNGKPVSAPVELRGSSGRWRPIATAESWAGNGAACNHFNYRAFEGVRVAASSGGSWRSFVGGQTFLDSGYRCSTGPHDLRRDERLTRHPPGAAATAAA